MSNPLKHRTFSFPTPIRCGQGIISQTHLFLNKKNLCSPLIVCDKNLANTEMLTRFILDLKAHDIHARLFDNLSSNPNDNEVSSGVTTYLDHKCDSLVAFGGGAAMDVAKAIGLLVNNEGRLLEYDDENDHRRTIQNDLPFLVAIPTTAGTGSEVGRSCVISDSQTHIKRVICHEKLMPALVLVDPDCTKTLPANMVAATGIDALTHNIEAFLVDDFHPLCDAIAISGINFIGQSLVCSYTNAQNNIDDNNARIHRLHMMMAAMMGAIAFQKGLGANHSLAHALSTVKDLHHGLANAIVLPALLHFNFDAAKDKYKTILNALGTPNFDSLPQCVGAMLNSLNIKPSLSHYGVKLSELDKIASIALSDGCHLTNPKPVVKSDLMQILQASF